MFKIEKDVPTPTETQRTAKYPFGKMEVGDSIFISSEESPPSGSYSASSYYALRHPELKFTTRKVEGGYRIWRIK